MPRKLHFSGSKDVLLPEKGRALSLLLVLVRESVPGPSWSTAPVPGTAPPAPRSGNCPSCPPLPLFSGRTFSHEVLRGHGRSRPLFLETDLMLDPSPVAPVELLAKRRGVIDNKVTI